MARMAIESFGKVTNVERLAARALIATINRHMNGCMTSPTFKSHMLALYRKAIDDGARKDVLVKAVTMAGLELDRYIAGGL